MRSLLFALLLLPVTLSAADAPVIRIEAVPAPSTPAAFGASIAAHPDGTAWLAWFEPAGPGAALRFATWDRVTHQWSAPGTIASAVAIRPNATARPAVSVGERGDVTVVWPADAATPTADSATASAIPADGAVAYSFSQTTDRGRTWSSPRPLTSAVAAQAHLALATLADGRVLAAWLDERAGEAGTARVLARIVGAPGEDQLIDAAASSGSPLALTAFPNGSALVGYRGRTAAGIRDIQAARFHHGRWESPHPVHEDGWRVATSPNEGLEFTSDGGRVAAAWFTAADNDPRVLATLSPDAGARFLVPLRLSETKAAGRVSTALLHDGAMLVTWVDAEGGLWLRRVTPDFVTTEPVVLASPAAGRVIGHPRLALLQDYAGGKSVAHLAVAFERDRSSRLHTLLVTVPEGELVEAEKNCDCSGGSEDLQGFALRGRILAATSPTNTLRVAHYEVPGILDEGTREFVLAPDVTLAADASGRPFLGRFERRAGQWVLFSVRLIGAAPVEK